ncbi:MAG TPA: helix-turn-helix transcriptional regulator [Rhodocyclaceae bacterium]|nr:helix-turn-helix transcriptional regulator [Rhodocyclaceae bacterium]
MKFREWRISQQLTLKQVADLLGIGHGANPSRRVQRIENGESPVDALLADKIVEVTGGQVTLQDQNDTRRQYLASGSAPHPHVEAAQC